MAEPLLKTYPNEAPHNDHFVRDEMLVHPALFSLHQPTSVLILGYSEGILSEVLKHRSVKHVVCVHRDGVNKSDDIVTYHLAETENWINQSEKNYFDIVILNEQITLPYADYLSLLKAHGIFVSLDNDFLFDVDALKAKLKAIKQGGFAATQLLNFIQPSIASGRRIILASKHSMLKRLKEKEIYNRGFVTRYYNHDVHNAALVQPEFIRQELDSVNAHIPAEAGIHFSR